MDTVTITEVVATEAVDLGVASEADTAVATEVEVVM